MQAARIGIVALIYWIMIHSIACCFLDIAFLWNSLIYPSSTKQPLFSFSFQKNDPNNDNVLDRREAKSEKTS